MIVRTAFVAHLSEVVDALAAVEGVAEPLTARARLRGDRLFGHRGRPSVLLQVNVYVIRRGVAEDGERVLQHHVRQRDGDACDPVT